jgi:competence protein ComGC
MGKHEKGFSIVDFLIIMAILLIVLGMFGPYLSQGKARQGATQTAVVSSASVR